MEIEAGDYWRDVAVWKQNKLTLRGVHGRVRMIAAGASAEGKAIWVLRGGDFLVENIEFSGVRVADKNGAGIRFEQGRLVVKNCVFEDSENGILTANDKNAELDIEGSEFGRNGAGDGRSHNLYVGAIRKLTVTGSYFHHARIGHLLKSRARENHIFYNRLTDELGGTASYELEFPNGGMAYVVGNIIQQGSQTDNPHVISFGVEGYTWPRNELYLVHNTLVDDRPANGVFLRVSPGSQLVMAVNNLLIGKGKLETAGPGVYQANFNVNWGDVALATRYDYRLVANSPVVGKAVELGEANGVRLRPDREYAHPHGTRPIPAGTRLNPGAVQSVVP
ncbi:MAG: hypothetical protein PHU46_11875 [Rhodocyclaceae bacterium]|nr:hypothetical protein [Rhodocyclaceae bacterium]